MAIDPSDAEKAARCAPRAATHLVCRVTSALIAAVAIASATPAAAAARPRLGIVQPVTACAALTAVALPDTGARSTVRSAELVETAKGTFCKVVSDIAPAIVVTTYLPKQRWTQRYFQGAGVGAAGPEGFPQAGTCLPALNGEFAYANSNQRFTMVLGDREQAGWLPDPQRRIDYAYRANHITAIVSKRLIRAYYGKGPRYSYLMGCSEGGREALVEAQRFPDDFNGISAGAPGLLSTMQEAMFHVWKVQADRRADGSGILSPAKLRFLHDTVVARCRDVSGVQDGLLIDPGACTFDPRSILCPQASVAAAACFTREEADAINRLYDGPNDGLGTYFYWGLQRGSEAAWNFPSDWTNPYTNGEIHARQYAYILLPEADPALADPARITFTQRDFDRATALSPLFDAADTNLSAFSAGHGRLIIWHGMSDTQIPAGATAAYYRALRARMGKRTADQFARAFFLPGVGHCGGGDGFDQIDILSALMNWVELGQAPDRLMMGKAVPGGRPSLAPAAASASATVQPYAAATSSSATRPVYRFPFVARYLGRGNSNAVTSYRPVERPDELKPRRPYQAIKLIGSDVRRGYKVSNGEIVSSP